MKKVGLAVVTYKDNFGSALQTYATQETIQSLGFDAECICADGIMGIIESRKKRFYLKRAYHPEEFKYLVSYTMSRLKKNRNNNAYASNMQIRHKKYVDFNEKYLRMSRNVHSMQELTELCFGYSAVVVGSDQLWRPSNIAGGYFTLEAVPDKVKKIAYSTSFGVKKLPKEIIQHAKTFLTRMDHISVREETGRVIASELTGRNIPVVCDPTMLITSKQWFEMAGEKPIAEGNYIVCYLMGNNPEHREFVKRLREESGFRVIALLHGSVYIPEDEYWPDEKPYDVGPCEFINLLRFAKYVCTDSFHCCVFSILCKTPFFVFRRDSEDDTTSSNDRIYTLLKWTGLEERLLTGKENVIDNMQEQIGYEAVEKQILAKQDASMKYLTTALAEVK
ncbi:MAG: polysaccharide pyruvyl transferase family protein [Bacteroidaceae bacterium]|nr:polysaccharide pyruvyl transferase family protein [Bacteroidaceae bacterium]